MDTRDVVLVDAFATDPGGGVPVAVLPDAVDLTDDQVRAVARELDALAISVPTDGPPAALDPVGPRGVTDPLAAVVGTFAVAAERGWIESGTETVTVAGIDREVTITDDGRVWVDIDEPNPQPIDVDIEALADALAVPVAALRDVGADLPPVRLAGSDALAVPINFLEHLGNANPDGSVFGSLADEADVDTLCAFTFDTLSAEATCHARTFVPELVEGTAAGWVRSVGLEVPAAPAITAGLAVYLYRESVVDDPLAVEQGHYLDRSGLIAAKPGDVLAGGRAVTTLDGTVTVPPADDEEILEV